MLISKQRNIWRVGMNPKIGYLIRELLTGDKFTFIPEEEFSHIDEYKYDYEVKRIVYFEIE